MATFLNYINNNELLSRRFVAKWWDADSMSFSEHKFTLGDEVSDSDYEFKYALADEIDEIIKLEINDTHFMSFNRDDDRHKGVVVRVSQLCSSSNTHPHITTTANETRSVSSLTGT